MVYHEIRKRNGKKYNYIIYNERVGNKWHKKSKFIGTGNISKKKIQKELKKFKLELLTKVKCKFLNENEVKEIEQIKNDLKTYFKKAGRAGTQRFDEWFTVEFTYNTNAIEGNTLSLRDTSLILYENIVPKDATLREIWEARNHKQAFDFMQKYDGDLNERFILKLHSFILKNIDNYNAGRYREVNVYIRGADVTLHNPKEVPGLMKRLISWYKKNKKNYHPFELAAIVSMKFVTLHPFVDGNGRTSRLIMNFILNKNGYPQISIPFKKRNEYYKCVRRANDREYEPIIKYLVKILKDNYERVPY